MVDLDLCSNGILNINSVFNLHNLFYLAISDNKMTDLSPISNLVKLCELYCSLNEIEDINPVVSLVNRGKLKKVFGIFDNENN